MAKSVLDQVIDALQKRKREHSHVKLSKPADKSEFGYGQACGYYQALDEFEVAIKDILEKEKQRD